MVTLGIETTGKQIVAEYGANAKGKTGKASRILNLIRNFRVSYCHM